MWIEQLLARTDTSAVSRSVRNSSSMDDVWFVAGALFAIAAFGAGLYYWDLYRKKFVRRGGNPKSLFLELCRAHQLSRPERDLLLRIAQAKRPGRPALLFVEREIFDKITQSRSAESHAVAALSDKLFGREEG